MSEVDLVLEAWDRHNTVLLNLLGAIPAPALAARAMSGSPSVAAMFAHMHHERMVSVLENCREYAGEVPAHEWSPDHNTDRLAAMLRDSSARVRDGVKNRTEAGKPLDRDFGHPLHLVHFLIFHEAYHHGQIKLALKAFGSPIPDGQAGPLTWDVWRAR